MSQRIRIAIIGGGPAGLMAADTLAPHAEVDLYEHGRNIGRKFLVAGQGGFNITNEAQGEDLLSAYSPKGFLDEALAAFGPGQLSGWLRETGIETFTGTSGRIFPVKGIKPVDVLALIRERLLRQGVRFHVEHVFTGFDTAGQVRIENADGPVMLDAERVIFALGGASWPVTGSTGIWPPLFSSIGVEIRAFEASNCGVEVAWPEGFIVAHEGKPLKNIRISAGEKSAWGEATLTAYGLEGNAIYPIVPAVRDGAMEVCVDLKPDSTPERLLERIGGKSPKNYAAGLNLNRTQTALLKAFTPKEVSGYAEQFAAHVKDLRIPVKGLRPIGEAISTVGGIPPGALGPDFSLKLHPHLYTIGEMVDWDAPTGGFLLQGCFAMGRHTASSILLATQMS